MRRSLKKILVAICVLSLWAAVAKATPIKSIKVTFQQGNNGYVGTTDTMLLGSEPDADYSTFPKLLWDAEDYNTGFPVQSLLRFKNVFGNGSNQIPEGASITEATLTLQIVDHDPGQGVYFHQMLMDWSDTDTWNTFQDGIQTDGIEAVNTPDASFLGYLEPNQKFNIDVITSMEEWIQAPSTNFGWVLIAEGTDGSTAHSSEGLFAPMLQVTYVPEPATVFLLGLGSILLRRKIRNQK